MVSYEVVIGVSITLVIIYVLYRKDSFYNIQQETQDLNDNYYRPLSIPQSEGLTKADLKMLIKEINLSTPSGGANTSVSQNKYDLLFKDILVSSDKRNKTKYPNPNNYYIHLNIKIDRIYKAELIDVYVPAATDNAVNIPPSGNRLYFSYTNSSRVLPEPSRVDGYIEVQAGTFISPDSLACELSRQFGIVLKAAGIILSAAKGIKVLYDKDLNRYIIKDLQTCVLATVIIYAANGFVLSPGNEVINSIAPALMLNNDFYVSGPKTVISVNGNLVVSTANLGDYGFSNGIPVPLNVDSLFSNSIISEQVLTHCKLYLSLGKLNGDTCNITPDENGTDRNVPSIFCQIPNNTTVSSASVKTLLNQPHNFSAVQFYNPCISKLNKFEIKWYTDDGSLVRILDHCFTVRVYYFQKRIDGTDFSYPIP